MRTMTYIPNTGVVPTGFSAHEVYRGECDGVVRFLFINSTPSTSCTLSQIYFITVSTSRSSLCSDTHRYGLHIPTPRSPAMFRSALLAWYAAYVYQYVKNKRLRGKA